MDVYRQSITRVMQLYKDRFLAKLSESEKANADFGRPVFLAVAFYLVARKNKARACKKASHYVI
jgi:origin recognition complex subunit 6